MGVENQALVFPSMSQAGWELHFVTVCIVSVHPSAVAQHTPNKARDAAVSLATQLFGRAVGT
jgi:hypothetical protein